MTMSWICNVKAKDEVSSDSLLTKLGIQDLDVVLPTSRMRWFGHKMIKNDRKKLYMDSADPQNRSEWRGRLRGRLVKKPNPRSRKTGSKTDMMMMIGEVILITCIHCF